MAATTQPTKAKLKRDLASVMRRYRERERKFGDATAERDRVIRNAVEGGLSGEEIKELTGLSQPRISQLGRGIKR